MHTDPEKAAHGYFHGLIASGWQTAGLMIRVFVQNYMSTVAHIVSPGVDELRWIVPVRPGDRLMVRISVLETRASRTKPDRGVVTSLLEAINQEGVVVCSMKAINLLTKRDQMTP
jgi:acyl dehydratase